MKTISIIILSLFVALQSFGQFKTINQEKDSNAFPQGIDHESINKGKNAIPFRAVTFEANSIPFNVKSLDNQLQAKHYKNGLPRLIAGVIDHKANNIEGKVMEYLKECSPLMKIHNAQDRFVSVMNWDDKLGSYCKMIQTHNGVKIYGAEIILHERDNQFSMLNGRYHSDIELVNVNSDFELDEKEVKEIVLKQLKNYNSDFLAKDQFNVFQNLEQWKIEKVLFKLNERFRAVFFVEVYENIGSSQSYFVDAQTGEILRSFSNICQLHCKEHRNCQHNEALMDGPSVANARDLLGQNRTINTWEASNNFYLVDGSRSMFQTNSSMPNDGVGVILTIDAFDTAPQNSDFNYDHFTSSNNTFSNDEEGVSAHYNGGEAYEYFKDVHGRESISGDGGNIYSFVNVAAEDGRSMGNAFWNGAAIFYGNGDSAFFPLGRSLDVAGHEMSHGVIQSTANLEYYSESGAMNESFADIFGAMMDREDWRIGEDVVRTQVFDSGALRDMEDPHNGQATGDFGGGWQPKHTNEQFQGPEDNQGVHINSGIPNHAFYLFATNSNVGKDRAERVFYRALTTYLTRSSEFVDLRVAVVQSAEDLYGANVAAAAQNAFDQVGIVNSNTQTNYEEDAGINPGDDFILFSDEDRSNLFIRDVGTGSIIADPLSQTDHISRPSVSDNGEFIVFVSADNNIHLIVIDWNALTTQELVWDNQGIWRQAIVSKDATKIAGLTTANDNFLYVYDDNLGGGFEAFELTNPTFTEGVSTGDVQFADVMEFDFSGENIVYDALNVIQSNNSGSIEYWDIGFINVFDNASNNFAEGNITKLFNSLPEGVSVGNPTFSKNSPYILAMDLLEDGDNKILGVNIERAEASEMFSNVGLNWPSYSRNDEQLIFDLPSFFFATDIGELNLNNDKITAINNSDGIIQADGRWGVWFSNGERNLNLDVIEINNVEYHYDVFPNPFQSGFNIALELPESNTVYFELLNLNGQLINRYKKSGIAGHNNWTIPAVGLIEGTYVLKLQINDFTYSKLIVKK